jgi:uncharacterized protein involved in exopolysaccharide biosynthesis
MRDVLHFLLVNRTLLIAIFGATTLLTALFVYVFPLQYEASGTLLVEAGKSPTLRSDPLLPNVQMEGILNSEISIVQSRAVVDSVVDRLRLLDIPERKSALHSANRAVKDFLVSSGLVPRVDRRESWLHTIGLHLKVTNPPLSNLIVITYRGENPALTAAIARGVIDAYLERYREIHSDNTADFFKELVEKTETKMDVLRTQIAHATNSTEIDRLNLEQDALQKSYFLYREGLDHALADQSADKSIVNVRLADYPAIPQRPMSTRLRNIFLGMAAGIVLAFGITFLRSYLDHTVRTPDDLSEHLDVPILGSVRQVPKRYLGAAGRRGGTPAGSRQWS